MRLLKAILCLIAVTTLFVGPVFADTAQKVDKKCPKTVKVQVQELKASQFTEYKSFTSTFNSDKVTLKSTVAGKVTEIKVSEGDLVSQDFVIAIIDDALKAEIVTAEEEMARWQRILKARQNWAQRSERAEQQAERKIAEEQKKVEELKQRALNYVIKTPVAGKIKQLLLQVDAEVEAEAVVAKIENDKTMNAKVAVDTGDLNLFSSGQKISVQVKGVEGEFSAEVTEISGSKVLLTLADPMNRVQDGASFSFRLVKQEYTDAVVIDQDKILKDEQGQFVYTIVYKYTRKKYIKTGAVEQGKVLVVDGVKLGEEIIVTELDCVQNGKKIKIMVKDPLTGKLKVRKAKKAAPKEMDEVKAKQKVEAAKRAAEDKKLKDTARAEKKKKAQEEKEQRAAEDKKLKDAAKAEKIKKAQEEKERRAAERAEKKKRAQEEKAKRDEEKAEKKRQALEAKKQRDAEKAERKRLEQEQKAKKCPKRVKVVVEKVKGSDFQHYKSFTADFVTDKAAVKSTVPGKVTEIKVAAGDLVSQDLVLVVIDNALQDQIKEAEQELVKWQRTLATRTKWRVRSPQAEKQAETKIDEAEAALEELKTKAADYSIKTPLAGTIASLQVSLDQEINSGDTVAEIVNQVKKVATLAITVEDKALFSLGQQIPFKKNGEDLQATVIEIAENQVKLVVEDADKTLPDAFNLTFRLVQKEYSDVVVLAESLVLTDESGKYVYTAAGNLAKKQTITIAVVQDGQVLVTDGLSIGDELIVQEILNAKAGTVREAFKCLADKIRIVEMRKDPDSGAFKKVKRKVTPEGIKPILPDKLNHIKLFFATNNFQSKSSDALTTTQIWNEESKVDHKYEINYSFSFGAEFARKFYFGNSYVVAGLNFDTFSKPLDSSFTASIPHPFYPNQPREKSFASDEFTLNQSNIYLSVLYPVFEKGVYSGRLGIMLGLTFGNIQAMESYSITEKDPYSAADINVTQINSVDLSYSGLLAGIRLENVFRISETFEVVVRLGYVFTNSFDLDLNDTTTLTLKTNRIQAGIGFQMAIF